jgi:hypothetical protein
MALSKETADVIVRAVMADGPCQKAISPNPTLEAINYYSSPLVSAALQFGGLAGSVRNAAMMVTGVGAGEPDFDARICVGIAAVTVAAINRVIKAGLLPLVHACAPCHRVHWGTHHQATWIAMKDDSQYVFDWHATLSARDPIVSTSDNWDAATGGINYLFFSGFA